MKRTVSHDQTGKISRQITVASKDCRTGIGQKRHTEYEDRIHAVPRILHTRKHPCTKDRRKNTDKHTEDYLQQHKLHQTFPGKAALHHCQNDHRQHIRAGIITTTLHLQHGCRVILQIEAF